ncbi:MAG TPA: lipase family protein, partial [Ferruginibacter sp.]|nr:lipase family protein [Ferruginibacter sp.]
MKQIITVLIAACIFIPESSVQAQSIQPGFDTAEYRELMLISARTPQSETYVTDLPAPARFKRVYRSPILGLDNYWDFWLSENQQATISIRGTTVKPESWLANFYAAMVPATGTLLLRSTDSFHYQLASNPKAAVHAGWLTCMAYLSRDMLPKIREQYLQGVKNFFIIGHSQGGAISFLLTAYFYNLQKLGQLPADIRFKTYCSAGPKPGNLYFAYEYEAMTQNGWAYNVVNAADWVPQTPISVQTLNDFATTNPFVHAKPLMQKQKFPINLLLKYVYNQLNNSTDKAMRKYQKYLGKLLSGMVQKYLKEYREPTYFNSIEYVRAGNQIVLLPDDAYFKLYPDDSKNVFVHHFHKPYLYLLDHLHTSITGLNYNSVAYTPTQTELTAAMQQLQPHTGKKLYLHGMMGIQVP